MKQNKGEWAEYFVLLHLLGQGILFSCDSSLTKSDSAISILSVFHIDKKNGNIEFRLNQKTHTVTVVVNKREKEKFSQNEILQESKSVFKQIMNGKGRSFSLSDESLKFMNSLFLSQPKASNKNKCTIKGISSNKNDIVIKYLDGISGLDRTEGFSIKSSLSSAATLLNASSATNFTFVVQNCNDYNMDKFNSILDKAGRIDKIERANYSKSNKMNLIFDHCDSENFAKTLNCISIKGESFVGNMLKLNFLTNTNTIPELSNLLIKNNPDPEIRVPNVTYPSFLKRLLYLAYGSMVPSKTWDGNESVNGGLIIIDKNENVACIHSNNHEAFVNYLYQNTYLDSASAPRYNYASIYKENGLYYIKLNLSIRFKK